MESSNEIWAGREEALIIRNRDGALQLRMGAEEAVIKKSATAMYLYELLIHPNKPIRALDLDALVNPPEITCQSLYHSSNAELAAQGLYVQSRRDKDPCMDEQGIKEIKQRLVALNEKYAQLMEWHDYAALEEVSEERERLIEYLAPLLNPRHSPVLYQAQGGNPKEYPPRDQPHRGAGSPDGRLSEKESEIGGVGLLCS